MNRSWRETVVETAREYANFVWISNINNIYHGLDDNGVMVNTPDENYEKESEKCGWWQSNKVNRGMPYKWGGYSTIDDFMKGISEGKYAGNVPDYRERVLADNCVGLDGSGLVSLCWGLNKKLSTVDLLAISEPIDNIYEMEKGDIFLMPGKHVMIFVGFIGKDKVQIIDCTKSTGRTLERTLEIQTLLDEGYCGYRRIFLEK